PRARRASAPLFPYTTLFRSCRTRRGRKARVAGCRRLHLDGARAAHRYCRCRLAGVAPGQGVEIAFRAPAEAVGIFVLQLHVQAEAALFFLVHVFRQAGQLPTKFFMPPASSSPSIIFSGLTPTCTWPLPPSGTAVIGSFGDCTVPPAGELMPALHTTFSWSVKVSLA